MSHIATVDIEIRDLDVLQAACERVGLELIRDQKQFRWFGSSVGDYPLPEGFSEEELGQCEHAIRIPNNTRAYEIGVVRRRDGRPGYVLMWDFYAGGLGMEAVAGKDCCHLRQQYAAVAAMRQAQRMGFRVSEQLQQDGTVRLQLQK